MMRGEDFCRPLGWVGRRRFKVTSALISFGSVTLFFVIPFALKVLGVASKGMTSFLSLGSADRH